MMFFLWCLKDARGLTPATKKQKIKLKEIYGSVFFMKKQVTCYLRVTCLRKLKPWYAHLHTGRWDALIPEHIKQTLPRISRLWTYTVELSCMERMLLLSVAFWLRPPSYLRILSYMGGSGVSHGNVSDWFSVCIDWFSDSVNWYHVRL